MPPRIAITLWKRALPTFLGERTVLYTLGEEYVDAVAEHGAVPLLVPHVAGSEADAVLDAVDGLLIAGGGDVDPASYGEPNTASKDVDARADGSELALVRRARERGVPTLAICRGMQIVNVAFGGSLHQDIAGTGRRHGPISNDPDVVLADRHPVEVVAGSRLAAVLGAGERTVNNIHHQAIDRLADGFTPTAHAPDGVIEAIEPIGPAGDGWPLLAVQWHPEKLAGDDAPLFAWLAHEAAVRPSHAQ